LFIADSLNDFAGFENETLAAMSAADRTFTNN